MVLQQSVAQHEKVSPVILCDCQPVTETLREYLTAITDIREASVSLLLISVCTQSYH